MDTLSIGIAGGTGSGKTTLVDRILERFGRDICVVKHDNYYRRRDDLDLEERRRLNYDHPDAFETTLMVEHLRRLKAGLPVECPVYDFTVYNRTDRTTEIQPARVILAEGILLFADPLLCREFDIRIFVDADADERILRRIRRDVEERGRSVRSIAEQYLSTVKPMHERYVEPSRREADIIMPRGAFNTVALGLILNKIEDHLRRTE
ncbi:MAG: uridine kinase [Clostridia bacterium]|nr:uridine kinase [Clostridia bacterium]